MNKACATVARGIPWILFPSKGHLGQIHGQRGGGKLRVWRSLLLRCCLIILVYVYCLSPGARILNGPCLVMCNRGINAACCYLARLCVCFCADTPLQVNMEPPKQGGGEFLHFSGVCVWLCHWVSMSQDLHPGLSLCVRRVPWARAPVVASLKHSSGKGACSSSVGPNTVKPLCPGPLRK